MPESAAVVWRQRRQVPSCRPRMLTGREEALPDGVRRNDGPHLLDGHLQSEEGRKGDGR